LLLVVRRRSDRPSLAEVPLGNLPFFRIPHPLAKSLIEELEHAPESVQREVLAFLRHLRARVAGGDGSEDVHALLSLAESDWVTPEEDRAWRTFKRRCGRRAVPVPFPVHGSSAEQASARPK